jgi:hypothetical protein
MVRWTGVALSLGGALTVLINAGLTPLLPGRLPLGDAAALPVFAWRQGSSAVAAAFLLFGSIGLILAQWRRAGLWGTLWFVLAFLGTALLLANEWGEVFVVRALALRSPLSLRAIDTGSGISLYDVGAMIALGAFTLGWLGFAGWTLRAGLLARGAAVLVIAGFLAIPLLAAVLHVWGAVAGNVILGVGWCAG